MRLYFGNAVTTVNLFGIIQILTIGDEEVCSFWRMDLLYAALRQRGMDWTRRFRTRLIEAVHQGCSH